MSVKFIGIFTISEHLQIMKNLISLGSGKAIIEKTNTEIKVNWTQLV